MVWLQAQAAILLVLFLQQSAAQEAATEGDGSISSAEELRAALLDPGTPAAFIANDIFLNSSNWGETVYLTRDFLLEGVQVDAPPRLDWGRLINALHVNASGNITFANMILDGLMSPQLYRPSANDTRLLRAVDSVLWPTIVTDVRSQANSYNVTSLYPLPVPGISCQEFVRQLEDGIFRFGYQDMTLVNNGDTILFGSTVAFQQPVIDPVTNYTFGYSIQTITDTYSTCVDEPLPPVPAPQPGPDPAAAASPPPSVPPPGPQATQTAIQTAAPTSSTDTAAIVGGVLGGVLGAVALAVMSLFVYRRAVQRAKPAPLMEPVPASSSGGGSLPRSGTLEPLSSVSSFAFERTGSSSALSSSLDERRSDLQRMMSIEFDWQIEPRRLKICTRSDGSDHMLGKGAFGAVFLAVLDDAQLVALKVLRGQAGAPVSPLELKQFEAEMALLRSSRHTNVVTLYGGMVDGLGDSYMVTEYLAGGDLYSAIGKDYASRSRDRSLAWDHRGRGVALDIANGLSYLHQRGVLHLDIKSCNILLAGDGTAKVADVGIARTLCTKTHFTMSEVRGTFDWCSPEMMAGGQCSQACDIWSLGTVLWEIITGERPRRGRNRDIRLREDGCPVEIQDLVDRCLAFRPSERPQAHEIVELILSSPALPLDDDAESGTTTA